MNVAWYSNKCTIGKIKETEEGLKFIQTIQEVNNFYLFSIFILVKTKFSFVGE